MTAHLTQPGSATDETERSLLADLHPQFLTDADGRPLSVLLPIAEYRALIERIEDLEDLDDARDALARIERGEEETIPWEAIKAEHGL